MINIKIRKGEKLATKLTKSRFSVLQICKAITFLAVIASLIMTYYIITEQRTQAELAQDLITHLEGENEKCRQDWKALTERGQIIQTIEFVEDLVKE